MYIIQDMKVIVNFVLSESHISIKSNFLDAILRNSPFEEGFSKQISNDAWISMWESNLSFESRVVLDGSQTVVASDQVQELFESRVTLSENRINE